MTGRSIKGARYRVFWPCRDGYINFIFYGGVAGRRTNAQLVAWMRERGAELRQGLMALANKYDFIKEIRGEGLMVGVQLSVEGAPYVAEALANRVLINCTHETTLRLLPPYIAKSKDVKEFIKRMDGVFSKVSKANSKSADSPRAQKSEPAQDARTLAASR